MPKEGPGFLKRMFAPKKSDDSREAAQKEQIDPEKIVSDNRERGTQIAHALESVIAQAGLSEKLGTVLQREKRVNRLRELRDGYQDMPAVEVDVKDLDRETVDCITQAARCVETGDAMTFDFCLDALEFAVRVRVRITPQSVDVMKLYVNRSRISMDVSDARKKLEEHEKTLAEVRARGRELEDALTKQLAAGRKFAELGMERMAVERNEQQQQEIQTAINMLRTTLIEYEGHVTSFTVHIDGSNSGSTLSAEELEGIIRMNQDANEHLILDFKSRIDTLERASDTQAAQLKAAEDAVKEHQMNTLTARLEPETVKEAAAERAKATEAKKEEQFN